ncbi:MAG: metal-dependent hydrolase [Clostridia bacterium]|nr:metal-dependent hydrolase [Clostridia bacterium]
MKITYLGHACFMLDDGTTKVIVDPFLTGNPKATVSADEVAPDMIFVTHGHDDHLGDTVAIAKRTGAAVCCLVDMATAAIGPAGVENIVAANIGGWVPTKFGKVKFVNAIHGSGIPGCLSCGFIFEMGGKRIYHAGDTALTADMALLADENIDVALLPIGDFFTMGPKDAVKAAKMIKPALTVPMHYNTFPPIAQDPNAFAAAMSAEGLKTAIVNPGETLEV